MGMVALIVGLVPILISRVPAAAKITPPDPIKVGMICSLFHDIPKPLVEMMLKPFQALMEAQTGMHGQVVASGDADTLGRQLSEGEVHLGVFHGIEFAWARLKYPELQPLVVAMSEQRQQRACLVVRQDCDVTSLAGLQGKSLALPCQSRVHCRMIVERRCQCCGQPPKNYFSQLTSPGNQEDALDDVVDGVVQATVVDGRAFDSFHDRKPGRWAKLKVVQESEIFPAAVIAHKPSMLDSATLQCVRTGLLTAHQTRQGYNLLAFAGINGFKNVPEDYEAALTGIVKVYPPPSKEAK
jgi:ABC-type phosphate/phosphonate transport system substrate-binding protein